MRRHRFRPGDDGVSTVVGVVLLVGIAVMLMTTVGVFVLGFGPGEQAPESEVQFYEEDGNVTIQVVRPAGIAAQDLDIRVNGSDACIKDRDGWGTTGRLEQSDSLTVHGPVGGPCSPGSNVPSGSTVRVIWESSSGDRSDIVGEYETT